MIVRKTEDKDRCQVVSLWKQAQSYFKTQGIDQWQDGYPDAACLEQDMAAGESYVLVRETGEMSVKGELPGAENTAENVLATAFISFFGEPDYDNIYEGSWQKSGSYGVVHRVAVDPGCKGQGLAGQMIQYAVKLCADRGITSLRMDTHEDNRSMRRMLEKNGFVYRGIIYLRRDGAKRVAYEKIW